MSNQHELEKASVIPAYPVKIWEFLAIGLGGLGLVGVALFGLANQLFSRMQDAQQAESIVGKVINYQIPGGSKGLMSLNIGAESFALVGNRQQPSDVMILVTQTTIDPETTEEPRNFAQELDLQATLMGLWRSGKLSKQPMKFCDQAIEVEVRQGNFQLIEQKQAVPAVEYSFPYTQKLALNHIHLFATGEDAAAKVEQVFQTLTCRPEKS
jgi:hypothetical protein